MPKRQKKESKQYPIGKEEMRALPVTPNRREACTVIFLGVKARIENQLKNEREKKQAKEALAQKVALVKAKRAAQISKLYTRLVDSKLRKLAK